MQLRQQLERLTDAYFRAVIPLHEYERRRRDLEQRVSALAKQEEQLRDDAERQRQLAGLAASLEVFRERVQRGLAQANFEQRRQLALLLIDRVVVTDAEVEIRYVLPTSPESEHVRFCHLRKDYFHHPSAWEDVEAARDLRRPLTRRQPDAVQARPPVLGDHQGPAEGERQPGFQPLVGAVGPEQREPRELRGEVLEQQLGAAPVVHVGRVHLGLQQVALRVDQHLPLAAGDLLAAVVAARPADLRRAHGLAVDDRRRGLAVAADRRGVPLAQIGRASWRERG